MSRRILSALLGLLMVGGATAALHTGTASAATYSGYVMGYFTESPDFSGANYGLHLAVSPDGLNWTPLNQNNPVVTPTQGTQGLRDPFILRKQDGTFTILATDLKGTDWSLQNEYIHVWDSTDLRSFGNYRRLKLHSMPTHSWAPEAFWDASRGQYAIIYSASSGGHDVIMANYTTDFVNAGSPQVFFDPGYAAIDGHLHSANGTNHLFFKNNTNGTLLAARSSSLAPGSFTTYSGPVSHGGTEAPIVVKSLTSNTSYLWGDTYTPNGVFYAWQSTNVGGGTWTAVNQRAYTQPLNSKHATIQPITATEMANLLTRWGAPTWNRLKSYNHPDRYVRHQNNVGRVDPYPFDPHQDQQWRIVPGLANPAAVSFQSVNRPTNYLRHSGFAVVLAPDDGSAAFDADATFTPVAGLADASWTSYRSHNYPDRYLRHYAYALRVDPIATATERQDATFRVGY